MNVGALELRAAIRAHGLTLDEAGSRLGIPAGAGTVSRLVTGKKIPTLRLAAKIEREFGVLPTLFTIQVIEKRAP